MDYRGIIFDIDGTAIPVAGERSSPRLRAAIQAAQRKQIKVAAATGRSYEHAKPVLMDMGLTSPCVIMGGAAIIDPQTDKIVWAKALSAAQINEALKALEDCTTDLYIGVNPVGPSIHLSEFRKNEHPAYVIYALTADKGEAKRIINKMAALDGLVAHPASSGVKDMIDVHITHAEASKGHAVHALLGILKLDPGQVIGVGDGVNDVPIFQSVGYKIAIGNADGKLKKLADEVVPAVDEDGLAYVIEKYFLDVSS